MGTFHLNVSVGAHAAPLRGECAPTAPEPYIMLIKELRCEGVILEDMTEGNFPYFIDKAAFCMV